jgi:hypothetical protein
MGEVGGLAFSNDIILLILSVQGIMNMVKVCEELSKATDLVFSTDTQNPDKSKPMGNVD